MGATVEKRANPIALLPLGGVGLLCQDDSRVVSLVVDRRVLVPLERRVEILIGVRIE